MFPGAATDSPTAAALLLYQSMSQPSGSLKCKSRASKAAPMNGKVKNTCNLSCTLCTYIGPSAADLAWISAKIDLKGTS